MVKASDSIAAKVPFTCAAAAPEGAHWKQESTPLVKEIVCQQASGLSTRPSLGAPEEVPAPPSTPVAPRNLIGPDTPPFPPIGPVSEVFSRKLKVKRRRGFAPPPVLGPSLGTQLS